MLRAQPLAVLALIAMLAGCSSAPSAPAAPAQAEPGRAVLRDYIQPRAASLGAATASLQSAVEGYCANPGEASRARAKQQLGTVVEAWAQVEFLRFGPLTENNRLEHFFFWPDPRGVVQRQMRGVLAGADAALLAPARLREQSAAVQGLPALEYALYADDAAQAIEGGGDAGRYRCVWAAAVAGNLARLAREIMAGWQSGAPAAQEFAAPAATNVVYRSSGEVATEILKAVSTNLHVLRDQKLAPALGDTPAQARSSLLPLWRSGLTARYLAAGVDGTRAFLEASRLGATLPADARWIDTSVHGELRRVRADFDELDVPLAATLADETRRDLPVHMLLLLTNARAIVDENLAPALGVNLGFNSLDGD